jgi:hypothetical protein
MLQFMANGGPTKALKGVPVINEIALGYDAVMFDLEAVHANQVCTAGIYGQ